MEPMTRRLFLEIGELVGVLLVAAGSLPAALFWWRSSGASSAEDPWIDLGFAREIPEGQWLVEKFSVERRNRWRQEVSEEMLYLKRVGRDLTVLSGICPHARCLVQQEGEGFTCRCHSSAFDAQGRPLGGPAPRPLDEFEWKVEKGRLKVRIQQFRPGVAHQEALRT
jgi:menaquinol-cytochrome c reductase iron-sulfur subunit